MVQRDERVAPFGVVAAAACAAILAHGGSLVVNVSPRGWLTLTDKTRWGLSPDAFLFAAALVIVCAPIVGVGATARQSNGRSLASSVAALATVVSTFTLVSAALTIGWRFGQKDVLAFTVRSHATLAAVAIALAAWGALCGRWFHNPLDAVGISLLTTLAAAGGLLLGGSVSAALPRSLVAAGLIASPLFAAASAAQIDLLHSDLLYQISPLAHVQIDYPTWTLATLCYLVAAAICLLTLAAANRRSSNLVHN